MNGPGVVTLQCVDRSFRPIGWTRMDTVLTLIKIADDMFPERTVIGAWHDSPKWLACRVV